jgi:glycosyltransferase involved in cell wall biosynthesis
MRILVIIPAYNEAANITKVVARVRAALPTAVPLVIDDGSHDNTAQLARQAGARVIRLPYNLGIGGAVQTGFLYAARHDYDIAVQVDGDGQHDPAEIEQLLKPLQNNAVDLVVGSRFVQANGYRTPLARRLGIVILATCIRWLTGHPCSDPTSGFRASNRHAIEIFAQSYPQDYPEPEALILLWRLGLRTQEVPTVMNARQGGTSSITAWRSGYYMFKVLLAIGISMFRQPPQLRHS